MNSLTSITTIVTNILMAFLAIFCIIIAYNSWSPDGAENFGTLFGLAVVLGVAKIVQAIIVMIARGVDGIPQLFKK